MNKTSSVIIGVLLTIIVLVIGFSIASPVKSVDVFGFCSGKEGVYNITPYSNPNFDNYTVNCSSFMDEVMTLSNPAPYAVLILISIALLSVFLFIYGMKLYNYFKSILFTSMQDLNWFDLVICWIIIWPFLVTYIPYRVVLWYKKWRIEKKQMEENLEKWNDERKEYKEDLESWNENERKNLD